MTAAETMVRMGELVASADAADVLVSIGLGSCIGLALVARGVPFAGLAHIVLPESRPGRADAPGRFANLAVPVLLDRLRAIGVASSRLDAVLVGGAQMFTLSHGGLDIGTRNEAATRAALEAAGVRVAAAATGGTTGRTVRVHVGDGTVTVKEAGGRDELLLAARTGVER